ncbi:glycosyltransferase family 8 protein [uncultured Bacteroides sp.]|uniref:glycosyltransferase family 8 protein n=1 Tax=uncultured Bacteroides sp. TaxID=162156 RepID=UPI002AAAA021|nr:glycosyltransferase family 8 protein [uncultured Bacteroides sp.]
MDVVCNIDDNYTKYCVVMLTSLFENNKEEDFDIHIIAGDLSFLNKSIISAVVENKYAQKLHYYLVGDSLLSNFPISNGHISISTYYRLFLPSILPQSISKIIYLDCDLLVLGSLKPLWEENVDGFAIGCVEDMWSGKSDNYTRLCYDSSYSYFNAGVLLINLSYWRQCNFEKKALDYIQKYPERLLFNDQDVLNALLYNQKKNISFRWNMQDGFFRRKRRLRKESWNELDRDLKSPVIIHYTGAKKPWHYKSMHPYKSIYFRYLDLTQWSGERPKVNYLFYFNRLFNDVVNFLGLSKPKYRRV